MRLIYVALTRAKEQLILVGRVKDEKSLIKYEQLAVSDTHIAVNERLTATNPFVLIYGVLASINRLHCQMIKDLKEILIN